MALERRLRLVSKATHAPGIDSTVKVAFATSDMKHVDQHFGAADCFAVYVLNSVQASLAEAVQFGLAVEEGCADSARNDALDGAKGPAFWIASSGPNEDKLAAKIEVLDGCIAVYCQAIGAAAIDLLRAAGIQAVKVAAGSEIKDLIETLQGELRSGTCRWLARAVGQLRRRDSGRFDAMAREGWVE